MQMTKFRGLAAVLALASATSLASAEPPAESDAPAKACAAEDPVKAYEACTKVLADSTTAEAAKPAIYALRARALTSLAQADDAKAEAAFKLCLDGEGTSALDACSTLIDDATMPKELRASALFSRSKLHSAAGRGAEAMADFKKSLEGVTDEKPGKRAAALDDYSSAIKIDGSQSRIFAERGHLRLSINQLKEAEEDFEASLKINDKEGIALLGRGLIREAKGDPVGAVKDLKAITELPAETGEAKWLKDTATKLMSRIGAD